MCLCIETASVELRVAILQRDLDVHFADNYRHKRYTLSCEPLLAL